MILRRLTDALRRQDWVTVIIETLIVVLGVFLGLQVNNWNAERARRVADRQYLERLHAEVVELITIREGVIGPRLKNIEALESAVKVIFSPEDPRPLSLLECASIHHSHVYTNPSSRLPTVAELISSGRVDSLSSSGVRLAIQRYEQGIASAEVMLDAITLDSMILARKYPDLIHLNGLARDDFGLRNLTSAADFCDVDGMRANRAFLNDLAINRDRFEFYMRVTMQAPQNLLIDLHRVLDSELGIRHAPDGAGTP